MVHIEKQRTHFYSCLKQFESRRDNERAVFYIKCQVDQNGFLRQGASKESSTIAPTLEIVSNTYMEGVPRQRQSLQEERFMTLFS